MAQLSAMVGVVHSISVVHSIPLLCSNGVVAGGVGADESLSHTTPTA